MRLQEQNIVSLNQVISIFNRILPLSHKDMYASYNSLCYELFWGKKQAKKKLYLIYIIKLNSAFADALLFLYDVTPSV